MKSRLYCVLMVVALWMGIKFASTLWAQNPISHSEQPAVSYFDAQKVADSFARNGMLFDGKGVNYQVITGRRTKPGEVEIHTKMTDVMYVLDGSATFVTGGTAIAPRNVAPDEIRGREIQGGQVHGFKKGDVIIIPAGVPHWFKQVSDPFLYLVIKVNSPP